MASQNDENLASEVNITAPVHIPTMDSLAIKLVPADLVYRLEEYRSDGSRWESTLWTLIGAIIGVIVNWVTNERIIISRTSIAIIIILAVMAFLIGITVRDYRKRADEIKSRFLFSTEKLASSKSANNKVKVTVSELFGGKTVTAELPADAVLSRLVPALVTKMELPNNIQYSVLHKDSEKLLKATETLFSAKVKDGHTLVLLPSVDAVASATSIATPSKVKVTIFDQVGSKSVSAELPNEAAVWRLIPALVTKMGLPSDITYSIMHKESGKILLANASLKEAGVQTGDTLRLIPTPEVESAKE